MEEGIKLTVIRDKRDIPKALLMKDVSCDIHALKKKGKNPRVFVVYGDNLVEVHELRWTPDWAMPIGYYINHVFRPRKTNIHLGRVWYKSLLKEDWLSFDRFRDDPNTVI